MNYLILLLISFFYTTNLTANEVVEGNLDKIEDIVIQDTGIHQYQDYNSFLTENDLQLFYNDLNTRNTNYYYNSVILNLISNNNNYPDGYSQNSFILNKILNLNLIDNNFSFNRKIFDSILFSSFIKPQYNEFYLNYLFYSSRFEELCSYYFNLSVEQKNFNNNVIYSTICLLEKSNFSQLELLLELYDSNTISKLDSKYLNLFINNKIENLETNYEDLGIIDKYIVYKNPNYFKINNLIISSILDIEILINNNLEINYIDILTAFNNGIINKREFISILNSIKDMNLINDYVIYNDILSIININDKLKFINTNFDQLQMDYYSFSLILNEQFNDLKLLNANLKYPKAIYILLLSADNQFIDNFLNINERYNYANEFDAMFFEGVSNFMLQKEPKNIIDINDLDALNNPAILFFIQNNYLKINLDKNIILPISNKSLSIKNYVNYSIYSSINEINKTNKELLKLIKNLDFKNINEVDLFYFSKSLVTNKDFNQLFFNILANSYLNN